MKRTLGHSDADVLVHAVMDALLGLLPWVISDSIFGHGPGIQRISSIELLKKVGNSWRKRICHRKH